MSLFIKCLAKQVDDVFLSGEVKLITWGTYVKYFCVNVMQYSQDVINLLVISSVVTQDIFQGYFHRITLSISSAVLPIKRAHRKQRVHRKHSSDTAVIKRIMGDCSILL